MMVWWWKTAQHRRSLNHPILLQPPIIVKPVASGKLTYCSCGEWSLLIGKPMISMGPFEWHSVSHYPWDQFPEIPHHCHSSPQLGRGTNQWRDLKAYTLHCSRLYIGHSDDRLREQGDLWSQVCWEDEWLNGLCFWECPRRRWTEIWYGTSILGPWISPWLLGISWELISLNP